MFSCFRSKVSGLPVIHSQSMISSNSLPVCCITFSLTTSFTSITLFTTTSLNVSFVVVALKCRQYFSENTGLFTAILLFFYGPWHHIASHVYERSQILYISPMPPSSPLFPFLWISLFFAYLPLAKQEEDHCFAREKWKRLWTKKPISRRYISQSIIIKWGESIGK